MFYHIIIFLPSAHTSSHVPRSCFWGCLRAIYSRKHVCIYILIISDAYAFFFFSSPRKHHVQHLFQNVRVPLRARDPLQKSHQRAAVQMYRVRPGLLDKGTIDTELAYEQFYTYHHYNIHNSTRNTHLEPSASYDDYIL